MRYWVSARACVTIARHFTCHTKAVITKPQNVYILRDVLCAGYVAGCNTTFFGKSSADSRGKLNDAQKAKEDMEARLVFEEPEEGEWASMLAFIVPYDDAGQRDEVVSLSQRLLPWEVGSVTKASEKRYFPGGAEGWQRYNPFMKLDQIHYGEDIKSAEAQEFISQGAVNNSLCFLGPHRVYSPWSNTFQDLIPGQGHFGADALPGVRTATACLLAKARVCPALAAQPLTRVPSGVCTGCPLAPRRGGLLPVLAQRDGRHRGGYPLAARVQQGAVSCASARGAAAKPLEKSPVR